MMAMMKKVTPAAMQAKAEGRRAESVRLCLVGCIEEAAQRECVVL